MGCINGISYYLNKCQTLSNTSQMASFMVALCSTADHYIFDLWFLSFFILSFFPRLISAVGDWMSTILPHMVYNLPPLRSVCVQKFPKIFAAARFS